MPSTGTADPAFAALLASYSKGVQDTARAARQLILGLIPGAIEVVDAKTAVIGYGYGTGYKDMVCTLILSKGGVKLGLVGWSFPPGSPKAARRERQGTSLHPARETRRSAPARSETTIARDIVRLEAEVDGWGVKAACGYTRYTAP